MPNITEYRNPISGLDGGDQGASAAARAGNAKAQATASFGRDLGVGISTAGTAWTDQKAKEEISHGLAIAAQVQQNTTTAWNNFVKNSDPNDPTLAQRFQEEELEPILQSFGSSFNTEKGKAWADAHVGALRQHFFEKTAADQSLLAGAAAVQNITDFATAASNTAQEDPSSVNMLLGTADSAVKAMLGANPNLTPAQQASLSGELRQNMRKDILKGGFYGMAQGNPEAAQEALAKGYGEADLDAGERQQLFGFAATIANSRASDARAAAAAAKSRAKDEGDAFLTSAYAKGIDPTTGSWTPPPGYLEEIQKAAIAHPENFDRAEIQATVSAAEHATTLAINKTLQQSDPSTYEEFRKSLSTSGGTSKTAVNQAYADGKLSTDDWRMFLTAADDAKSDPNKAHLNEVMNEMFSGLKSTITKSNPFAMQVYPEQDQKFYEFQQMVRSVVTRQISKGLSPEEVQRQFLSPGGPGYLGLLIPPHQGWAGYQLSDAQTDAASEREGNAPIVAPTRALTGEPQARKPGESIAQWKARTGG